MPETRVITPTESPQGSSERGARPVLKLVAGLVVLLGLAAAARPLGGRLPEFVGYVNGLGIWGPAVFMLAYALGVVLFVPGSALTLAAGALFGVGRGLVFAWCAATLGASLSFLVARYLARDAVERRIGGSARFAAIDQAIGREGRKIVFLLRLSPAFPFTLLNFALGLTRIGFGDYVLASIGMIPGTLLYVYYGSALGLAAQVAGGAAPERGLENVALLGLGLVATLAVTIFVTRLARRALAQATGG